MLIDVNTIKDLADPVPEIQRGVDSIAGQHVNMTSIDILLQAIHNINPIPVLINLIIVLLIVVLTYLAVKFVDRVLENYIPNVIGKVDAQTEEASEN